MTVALTESGQALSLLGHPRELGLQLEIEAHGLVAGKAGERKLLAGSWQARRVDWYSGARG